MYVIGDTHGLKPVFEIIDKKKLEDQNLIHVGDLGLGFQEITRDVKNLLLLDEALMDTNNQFYVIRGNHDNPIFWDKSKGLNLPKFHNLHLMEDYSVKLIEEKRVLFVGGATSIDRIPRKRDIPATWWEDEIFTYSKRKIKDISNIDIIITHTCPSFCAPRGSDNELVNHYAVIEKQHGVDLHKELEAERMLLDDLYFDLYTQNVEAKKWYYGHFHSSKVTKKSNTEFILLNINEIQEVNL